MTEYELFGSESDDDKDQEPKSKKSHTHILSDRVIKQGMPIFMYLLLYLLLSLQHLLIMLNYCRIYSPNNENVYRMWQQVPYLQTWKRLSPSQWKCRMPPGTSTQMP